MARLGLAVGLISLLFLIIYGILSGFHALTVRLSSTPDGRADKVAAEAAPELLFSKKDVRAWLTDEAIFNLEKKAFQQQVAEHTYRVDTSLDLPLQTLMLDKIRSSKSRYIGFIALDPATGKILSLAGVNKKDLGQNPCLDNSLPAASIFKIVTAAAAIEHCGFKPTSKLTFNGNKYTLYKSQLKDRKTRYTNTITFQDSFAQSVNPIFGKLGANHLGRQPLEAYGEAFGFNQPIEFETYLPPSELIVSEKPYHWAEIASGFNRTTTLSPLHGALIAAAVLNKGRLPEPTIIESITDESGNSVYQGQSGTIHQAMTARSSEILHQMMQRTIKSGTCRKAFRGSRKDRILSRLKIGGKTGSIDNRNHDARIDWFVGFAEDKKGKEKIVVAAVVAHEKYIRTRASEYAKYAFIKYFNNYFTENRDKNDHVKKQTG